MILILCDIGPGDGSRADFGETFCGIIVFGAVDENNFDFAVLWDVEAELENDISDDVDVIVVLSVTDFVDGATNGVILLMLFGVVRSNVSDSLSKAAASGEVILCFNIVFSTCT